MNFSTQVVVTDNKSARLFKCTHFIRRVITGSEIFVFVRFVVTSMNFVLSSLILRAKFFCTSLSMGLQASLQEFLMQLRGN